MPRASFAVTVNGWDLLSHSALQLTGDIPHLHEQATALRASYREVLALQSRYAQLLAETRETARLLREAVDRGRELDSRLRHSLRGNLGTTSEDLIRHGLQPRRRGRHRAADPQPAAEPPPTPEG